MKPLLKNLSTLYSRRTTEINANLIERAKESSARKEMEQKKVLQTETFEMIRKNC